MRETRVCSVGLDADHPAPIAIEAIRTQSCLSGSAVMHWIDIAVLDALALLALVGCIVDGYFAGRRSIRHRPATRAIPRDARLSRQVAVEFSGANPGVAAGQRPFAGEGWPDRTKPGSIER